MARDIAWRPCLKTQIAMAEEMKWHFCGNKRSIILMSSARWREAWCSHAVRTGAGSKHGKPNISKNTERRDEAPVNTEDTYFPLGDGMIKFCHRSITCSNTLVNYSKKSALVMWAELCDTATKHLPEIVRWRNAARWVRDESWAVSRLLFYYAYRTTT